MQFFYDGQVRRYITQFIRLFSNFSVEMGVSDTGVRQYQTVPAYYGDPSRQVANILRNNSENTAMTVPAISCYITALNIDRDRTQEPYYIDKKSVRTRAVDPQTGEFLPTQGNMFTIERMMPTPFKLSMKCDIWTSNTEQKLQLIEQIAVLFNPSLEIQTTDNYLDWTSLTVVTLTDITFTGRAIPQGTESQIDVATMSFDIPIWLSSPAKVKKLGIIQDIITNIGTGDGDGGLSGVLSKKYVSLKNGLIVVNGVARLTDYLEGSVDDDNTAPAARYSDPISWKTITDQVGAIRNGTSKIYLEQDNGSHVVGTVSLDPLDEFSLMFSVDSDTIPSNTLAAVNKVINPLAVGPGTGLPEAVTGQRYLITQATGSIVNGRLLDNNGDPILDNNGEPIVVDSNVGAAAWLGSNGYLIASANDIIEYDGSDWVVVFDASEVTATNYVTNLTTNVQFKWIGTGWIKSWEGYYPEGVWNLVIE